MDWQVIAKVNAARWGNPPSVELLNERLGRLGLRPDPLQALLPVIKVPYLEYEETPSPVASAAPVPHLECSCQRLLAGVRALFWTLTDCASAPKPSPSALDCRSEVYWRVCRCWTDATSASAFT